jgi:hypothetical protein
MAKLKQSAVVVKKSASAKPVVKKTKSVVKTVNSTPIKKSSSNTKAVSKTEKPIRTIALPEVRVTAKPIAKASSNKKQNITIKSPGRKATNFNNSAISKPVTPQQKAINYAKGKKIVDPMDEIMSAPQKSAVSLLGGGYKKPSEALKVKNKYVATAVDTALDPTNALFFLKGSKLASAAEKASKPKLVQGINLTHPRAASRIKQTAKKYKATAASLDAQSIYNDLNKTKK